MKTIRLITTALLLCMTLGMQAQAKRLTESERVAQRNLVDFLRTKGFTPSIDSSDQSVCFKKNGTLYWISVEGNSDMILYTLFRNGIKYADGEKKEHNYRSEIAVLAANRLNTTQIYKAYRSGASVRFCMPMYAANFDAFKAAFPSMMDEFDNVKKDFDLCYKACHATVDSIHDYWQDLDTTRVVIEQKGISNTAPTRNITITNIAVRNVDAADNVISDYDQGIRQSKSQFLQPRVELKANKKGVYKVGVRIYNPDGKLLVPSADSRFTTISTVNVKKDNKPEDYDLLKFGSRESDVWKAGEYVIKFYEDDTIIYEDKIHIL